MSTWTLLLGDVRESLSGVDAGSVQTCVTSPPYWGLRDYGHEGQLGLEATPELYVASMVQVFREVRRVLRDDGTLWLNLGDSYAGSPVGSFNGGGFKDASAKSGGRDLSGVATSGRLNKLAASGLKPKDLVGIPWRVAFALQADGWYLRSDIIWHKPNPMPESVTDRPTSAYEHVFLLAKSERYYYDAEAIAEPATSAEEAKYDPQTNGMEGGKSHAGSGATTRRFGRSRNKKRKHGEDRDRPGSHLGASVPWEGLTRNARSVWTITTKPYPGAHFATFPPELAEKCIKAGSKPGDTVLDPFAGSGTTGMVATGHGRRALLCELNPDYADLIRERCGPMLEAVA